MNEIASRYGTALFSLALERNRVSEYQNEVKELKRIFKENSDFIMVLGSSFETIETRLSMVDKTLVNVNEYRGVDEGLVYSTIPLDEKTINKIEEKISKIESRKVELINKIDPALIGGVKVVINGHIYDGSIKNQIEMMKIDLLKKEERGNEN